MVFLDAREPQHPSILSRSSLPLLAIRFLSSEKSRTCKLKQYSCLKALGSTVQTENRMLTHSIFEERRGKTCWSIKAYD